MKREDYFSTSYSLQIKNLVRLIVKMKLYTSKILNNALLILESNTKQIDAKLVAKITEYEFKLKNESLMLEDSVNKIIALRQPVAFDLRFLLSSIKISAELNYAAGWAKKTIKSLQKIDGDLEEVGKKDLSEMLDIASKTLKDTISILLQFDSKKKADSEILFKIDQMLKKDDQVDNIYEKILQDGLSAIRAKNADPIIVFETIGIAKSLEKVSDCIHNIIITTRYVLTGKRL